MTYICCQDGLERNSPDEFDHLDQNAVSMDDTGITSLQLSPAFSYTKHTASSASGGDAKIYNDAFSTMSDEAYYCAGRPTNNQSTA